MEDKLSLRVQGVTVRDVRDWQNPWAASRLSQFFLALSRRVRLNGVTRPVVPDPVYYMHLARCFSVNIDRWRAHRDFHLGHTRRLNADLSRQLAAARPEYDLIVQIQTMCSPRSSAVEAPYVIYTDNTMANTQRLYPKWEPLTPAESAAWLGFETDVCRQALRVFTYSEFTARSMIEDYGCSPERVRAVGTGANQHLDSLEGRRYDRQRALFVGFDFERKGGPQLLAAWRLVRERLPEAQLTIVGPKRNPVPRGEAGVTYAGQAGRVGLAEHYSSADVFVMPSLYEPWGMVFVEAMGYGLPCIGTDTCAMPEIIRDGETGRTVPAGEPEPLADALVELLGDPECAERMGHAGFARMLEEMGWDHVVERMLQHLPERSGRPLVN